MYQLHLVWIFDRRNMFGKAVVSCCSENRSAQFSSARRFNSHRSEPFPQSCRLLYPPSRSSLFLHGRLCFGYGTAPCSLLPESAQNAHSSFVSIQRGGGVFVQHDRSLPPIAVVVPAWWFAICAWPNHTQRDWLGGFTPPGVFVQYAQIKSSYLVQYKQFTLMPPCGIL